MKVIKENRIGLGLKRKASGTILMSARVEYTLAKKATSRTSAVS